MRVWRCDGALHVEGQRTAHKTRRTHTHGTRTAHTRARRTAHTRTTQGDGIRHVLNPDPYRGAFGSDGPRYADDVLDVIQTVTPGRVAGFIAETIQGVGGTVPLAPGYLPAVYKARV